MTPRTQGSKKKKFCRTRAKSCYEQSKKRKSTKAAAGKKFKAKKRKKQRREVGPGAGSKGQKKNR